MRVECPNCGGAHPAWDCKRPATKSTAALMEVQRGLASKDVRDSLTAKAASDLQGRHLPREGHKEAAGTQALPVDTPTKRPRGRPRIHPDRKAYKAQWERDKRKRLREGK